MMSTRKAFTIMEMIVVLLVMAVVAGISLPLVSDTYTNAATTSTQSSLKEAGAALANYWSDCKLLTLDGVSTAATDATRLQIRWLFRNPVSNTTDTSFDPNSKIGWNGPYLLNATGDPAAFAVPTIVDAWNNAIVIQDVDASASVRDVRLVSGGPNGVVDIPLHTATSSLNAANMGDDLYVALQLH